MQELFNDNDENNSKVLSHEEILTLINEIKKYERKFKEYEISEQQKEEFLDIEPETWIPIDSSLLEKENKESFFSKVKHNKFFRIRFSLNPNRNKVKSKKHAATFKLRLNEDGELENLDFKKPKPKEESKIYTTLAKTTKIKSLINRKEKTNKKSKSSDKEPKKSKFKNGFKKLVKLRKAIPSKKSKGSEEGGSK